MAFTAGRSAQMDRTTRGERHHGIDLCRPSAERAPLLHRGNWEAEESRQTNPQGQSPHRPTTGLLPSKWGHSPIQFLTPAENKFVRNVIARHGPKNMIIGDQLCLGSVLLPGWR